MCMRVFQKEVKAFSSVFLFVVTRTSILIWPVSIRSQAYFAPTTYMLVSSHFILAHNEYILGYEYTRGYVLSRP